MSRNACKNTRQKNNNCNIIKSKEVKLMEAKANPVAKTNVRTQNIPICIYLTKDEKAIIKEKAKSSNNACQ